MFPSGLPLLTGLKFFPPSVESPTPLFCVPAKIYPFEFTARHRTGSVLVGFTEIHVRPLSVEVYKLPRPSQAANTFEPTVKNLFIGIFG